MTPERLAEIKAELETLNKPSLWVCVCPDKRRKGHRCKKSCDFELRCDDAGWAFDPLPNNRKEAEWMARSGRLVGELVRALEAPQ